MPPTAQLIEKSLDTLPIHVAILDADGTVLQTNQSWQEFGAQNNGEADSVGRNYLDICAQSSTETAESVHRGLSDVLNGTKELFTDDYPCHSPVEQRWFRLVAVPFTVSGHKHAIVGHVEITEYKQKERQLEAQREQLEALNQLNAAVRTLTHEILDQSTRSGIQQAACETLVETDAFSCAWLGDVSTRDESVDIRAKSGACQEVMGGSSELDFSTVIGQTLVKQAIWTGEIQVANSMQDSLAAGRQCSSRRADEYRSIAAIPVAHQGVLYSVLCVYTDRRNAFGAEERAICTQLGEVIGHAIAASGRKQALMSDELIEVELRIPEFIPDATTDSTDWTVNITQTVTESETEMVLYGTASEKDVAAIESTLDQTAQVQLTVLGGKNDSVRIKLQVPQSCLFPRLAEYGWSTKHVVLTNGDCLLTVHLPPGDDVRRLLEVARETVPEATLLSRQQIDATKQVGGVDGHLQTPVSELTERQRAVLQTAQAAGYFEWPRHTSGEELAETLGISPPTFHQHLRLGQRKIMAALLNDGPVQA